MASAHTCAQPEQAWDIWRESEEWGSVCSVIITEASAQVCEVHDRMPVIISPGLRDLWLQGEPRDAIDLCRPYGGELTVERTPELWVHR